MSTTPEQLGKYKLIERLGHGGVAEVWKALDTQLQRYVAIKILQPDLRDDPSFVKRFQREAQFIATLNHPNIVGLHDFQIFQPEDDGRGEQSPLAYMVMDYIEGETLADYIRRTSSRGQIPSPTEIVHLFTSISLAVDYAHQQGMIHRDIKPANILLDKRNTANSPIGEPILTDFGVAKLLSIPSSSLTGEQLGTPLYISPEQARGYPGNERSDLYALGIILYEVVTGVTPFRGNTPLDVIKQHVNATPTAPTLINPHLPPTLVLVIMRSLAKDPEMRFSSASSMAAAIADALNVPVPEVLGQPTFPLDPLDMPTLLASGPPYTQTGSPGTLSSSMPEQPISKPLLSTGNQANTPNANLTPVMIYSNPGAPAPPTTPPAAPAPPATPARGRRSSRLYAILIPVFILILLGAGLSAYFVLSNHPTTAVTSNIVGYAYYTSSGQSRNGTAQGIADRMQIDLQNVASPQSGKSYYAWLLPDSHPDTNKDQTGPRPIKAPLLISSNLQVQNGSVHFTYAGDGQNNNLISTTSRILITEENAGGTYTAPSSDRTTWRYYGEIPQGQIPGDNPGFSALTHIRHLFYNETNINVLGLPGGLDIWMLNNTEKVFEWAVSARDDWHGAQTTTVQTDQMHQQSIRILEYLDGTTNLHVDAPTGTPILVDSVIGKVSLLTVDKQHQVAANFNTDPPGYVDHVQLHVGQVDKATDVSPETHQRAQRILDAVTDAKQWLLKVHDDDVKLFQLNADQLKQPSTGDLLDDLVTQATYAYIGHLDPSTNSVQPGVIQAHYDIQQLATIAITKDIPQTL
jgi:serine/threonine protein kinase